LSLTIEPKENELKPVQKEIMKTRTTTKYEVVMYTHSTHYI